MATLHRERERSERPSLKSSKRGSGSNSLNVLIPLRQKQTAGNNSVNSTHLPLPPPLRSSFKKKRPPPAHSSWLRHEPATSILFIHCIFSCSTSSERGGGVSLIITAPTPLPHPPASCDVVRDVVSGGGCFARRLAFSSNQDEREEQASNGRVPPVLPPRAAHSSAGRSELTKWLFLVQGTDGRGFACQ